MAGAICRVFDTNRKLNRNPYINRVLNVAGIHYSAAHYLFQIKFKFILKTDIINKLSHFHQNKINATPLVA